MAVPDERIEALTEKLRALRKTSAEARDEILTAVAQLLETVEAQRAESAEARRRGYERLDRQS